VVVTRRNPYTSSGQRINWPHVHFSGSSPSVADMKPNQRNRQSKPDSCSRVVTSGLFHLLVMNSGDHPASRRPHARRKLMISFPKKVGPPQKIWIHLLKSGLGDHSFTNLAQALQNRSWCAVKLSCPNKQR